MLKSPPARPAATSLATFSASPAEDTIHWSLPLPKTSVRSVSNAETTWSLAPSAAAKSRATSAALRAVPLPSTPTTIVPAMTLSPLNVATHLMFRSWPVPLWPSSVQRVYGFLQHRRQPPHALGDGLRRNGAERQAE